MIGDVDDPILRDLRRLQPLEADHARAERIRARCRRTLARRERVARSPRDVSFITRAIEPAMIGGLCLIYLAAVVRDVLRLQAIL